MKQLTSLVIFACCLLCSCSSPSPDQYFGQAALNCNLLYGFAGHELKRDLASPSEKLVDEKTMAMAPMKRIEVVQMKIETVEGNFAKVKSLTATDDSKEMLAASKALYEYVLPVYKNEYKQLATLYDEGAPAEKTTASEKSITEKYEARFLELYEAAWAAGKAYAAKHGITVKEVNPTPPRH